MQYEPHEYCLAFPEMAPDEFRKLSNSVAAHGLWPGYEIVLFEGKILDGRHRYRACVQQHAEPRFREFGSLPGDGADPFEFLTHVHARRNLSPSQLAVVAVRLAGVEGARAKARQEASRAQPGERIGTRSGSDDPDLESGRASQAIGEKLGIGEKTVRRGINVVKKGTPEVVKAVENNVMSITEVEKVVKLNPDAPRSVPKIPKKSRSRWDWRCLTFHPMSAPTVNVPIGDLLKMAKQVIATADLQSRDLSDAEAIQVETLLDIAERYTHHSEEKSP